MIFNQTSVQKKFNIDFISGLVTGITCAGLLNPWDRALYLAFQNNRHFLVKENFYQPYQGATQTILHRALVGSVYYIMQGELNYYLAPNLRTQYHCNETLVHCSVGLLSGAVSGLLNNSVSTIKYHTWGQNYSFFKSARVMFHQGGLRPFFKGTHATIWRDSVFGLFYEMNRHKLQARLTEKDPAYRRVAANACAGAMASIASSPFNYVRMQQYTTPAHEKTLSTPRLLRKLVQETRQASTSKQAVGFFLKKCQVGWGSARVAVGIGLSQFIFDKMEKKLSPTL